MAMYEAKSAENGSVSPKMGQVLFTFFFVSLVMNNFYRLRREDKLRSSTTYNRVKKAEQTFEF